MILSLGFGIGSSATVYSWMQGLLLRPLPAVRDMDRLVSLRPDQRNGFGISLDEYSEWRAQMRTVSDVAGVSLSLFAIKRDADANAIPLYGMFVSGNYFEVLGVKPALGRAILAADDNEGGDVVAVLSDAAWRTHFGGRKDVLGQVVKVNGYPVRIVGVGPSNFGGNLAAARFDVWVPLHSWAHLSPSDINFWKKRDSRWLDAIGRLKPEVTVDAADREIKEIAKRQAAQFPENEGRSARAMPLDVGEATRLAPLFVALVVVTTLVVLLICSNVANLLLARAASRYRELAVRLSIGASRARVVGQLLTESALLAAVGAGLGLIMALSGGGFLEMMTPPTSVAISTPTEFDFRFFAVVAAVTGGSVLVFGLAPALIGSRVDLVSALKDGSRGSGATKSRMRGTLVVAQFAFALAVLVAAALFLRRDTEVRNLDLGFREPEKILVSQMEISISGYTDMDEWRQVVERVADQVRAAPGVQSAAIGSFVPLGIMGYARFKVDVPGAKIDKGLTDLVYANAVSPGYFDLMGIPILNGRPIDATDVPGGALAAVVNQAFAKRYFNGAEPVGRFFKFDGKEHLVVGVAKNGRYDYRNVDDGEIPLVYYAFKQRPAGYLSIHVKAKGDAMAVAPALQTAVSGVDEKIALISPMSLEKYVGVPFAISKSAFTVLGILGGAGLILASMGLFSVISYGVTLRTREVGIRIALGATPAGIIRMFLDGAMRLVLFGTLAGIVAATALTTLMRSEIPFLPSVSFGEYALPVAILASAAIVAGLVPSTRAASVDPARTLRVE